MDINNIQETNFNKVELKDNLNQPNNQYNTISVTHQNHQNNEQNLDDNIFHKKKHDFDSFVANPDVEEIHTFTYENDRNLNSYKGRIYNKSNLIEQYSKNYLEYMKKFENKRNNVLRSPFLVYQEKTKGNNINYRMHNGNSRSVDLDSYSYSYSNKNNQTLQNPNIYNINQNNDINNGINNSDNNYNYGMQSMDSRSSTNSLGYSGKSGEITNPNYFYQRNNKDYYKYKMEQKRYLDYNYELMKNKLSKKKREPDVNPYNPINDKVFENGKTDLLHNPILNPINNYAYNKYLEKEVNGRYKKNSNGMNHNFSTLQQAGNQLLNN